MNHRPHREPEPAPGQLVLPSRRGLIVAGIGMALAHPLLSASARARWTARAQSPDLPPMEALAAMAASCDMAFLLTQLQSLAISPVLAGNATTGAPSMNAAIDALEHILGAGFNSLAAPIAIESMGPDHYSKIVGVNAPLGQPMIDYMFAIGHPSVDAGIATTLDLDAAFANRRTLSGIENLSFAQLEGIRQNLATLIPQSPELCAGLVLGASASIGALTLPDLPVALGLAIVGFTVTGASASLL